MSKISEEKKQQLYVKYKIALKPCEECGKLGAVKRHYNGRTLCNSCNEPLFKAYLKFLLFGTVSAIILGLILIF